jgi:DNA-binding SARP family transcriptional activator/Tfp pilus assembly protein PilF
MEFRILGPLEVWCGGRRVPVSAAKQRTLLAILLLRAGRVVAAEALIDRLWGERPPATARKTLHNYVRRLRTTLAAGATGLAAPPMLLTEPSGYLLRLGDAELDLHRFQRLREQAQQATSAGDLDRAAALLRQALGLWRGPALADMAAETLLRTEAARLEEQRLAVLEARIQAELELGWHAELVGELEALAAQHPLRESFCGQLMLALYRCGRQVDALGVYRAARRLLIEEFGVEPGPELQRLERAMLVADPSLAVPARPAPSAPVAQTPDRAIPAQLPADVAAFTGRRNQLEELDRLLEPGTQTTAVVITAIAGTAGVGKTGLAVHWAHRVRGRFPDGQLYVNLRGYAPTPPASPIEALAGSLRALGVAAEQVPVDLDEAAGLFRTQLADKRMLVLLDNARDPDQVRPLLPGSPGCLVVVTSRDRLGGLVAKEGARRLTLDVLTPDEARDLLGRLLGETRVHAEPAAAAELARVCAHLPLALRIAAANLADRPQRSIAGYVAELGQGDRLGALAVAGDEQAAVRAAFDLSYTVLTPQARRLFRLLGLVPGPEVTAAAAAALIGAQPQQAAQLLDRLAAAHLLGHHAAGRFAFHDLLRRYAADRAQHEDTSEERKAATGRLLDWYLHTVDAAARLLYPDKLRLPLSRDEAPRPATPFHDHSGALAWLDAERPNLLAAVQYAAERGPRPLAWLLADALRGYFWLRMHTVDWLAVAHAGLAAAQADRDLRAQAAAHLSIADVCWRQSRYQQAVEHYSQALGLNRATGWLEGQAAALGNLANVICRSGKLEQATDRYLEALALNRQIGWLEGQVVNLANLGMVCWEQGRLHEAAVHAAEALALHRRVGSRSGEAIVLSNLGEICHALGRLEQAFDHFNQGLALHREVGDRVGEADALRGLAATYCDTGGLAPALELAHAALALAREVRERRFEADALNALATIQLRLGQQQAAIDQYRQALRLARETENHYPEVEALNGLAAALRGLGDLDQAVAHARQAVQLARLAGYRLLEGQALTILADVSLAHGDPGQAGDHARQALALHRETGHRLGEARTLLVLGLAHRHTSDAEAALPLLQQALGLFTAIGASEAQHARDLLGTLPAEPGR